LAKVEALAAVDVVLVLYNPAGRTRREPWQMTVAALQRHRAADTPVAAVRRAYREGQAVELRDVARMAARQVDMETVVTVGSRPRWPWTGASARWAATGTPSPRAAAFWSEGTGHGAAAAPRLSWWRARPR